MKFELPGVPRLSYEDIEHKHGFYLNVANGLIYKHNGQVDQQTHAILRDHNLDQLRHHVFVFVSHNLTLSNLEVKTLIEQQYGIPRAALGKVVDNDTE